MATEGEESTTTHVETPAISKELVKEALTEILEDIPAFRSFRSGGRSGEPSGTSHIASTPPATSHMAPATVSGPGPSDPGTW